jgi:hypothetical protein
LLALVPPLLTRLRAWLGTRWPLVACSVALTLAWQLPGAAPPPRSLEGVAALLGAQIGGSVAPDGFVWERSHGPIIDPLLGRDVLFLARSGTSAPRDLYRARVRVTREGRPMAVRWVRNLTQTPLADEAALIARDHHAAFVTRAFDSVQAITVLDLRGQRELLGDGSDEPRPWSRLWMQLDGWLAEGSFGGLGRSEMVFGQPPASAKIELRDGSLIVALSGGPGETAKAAALDIDTGRLNTGAKDVHQTLGWRAPWVEKPLAQVLRASLSALIGEERTTRLSGLTRRWREGVTPTSAEHDEAPAPDPPALLHESSWPPASLVPLGDPLKGEGKWQRAARARRKASGVTSTPDPYLWHAFLRPDGAASTTTLRLVAIDTRQLELRTANGWQHPRPHTGPRGSGRIPAEDRARAVAAFNGASPDATGIAGMVVGGRVLTPPVAGVATVATDHRGHTQVGVWPGNAGAPQPRYLWLRQSSAPRDGRLTTRSALCRTRNGYLMYGWIESATPATLERGMKRAGCSQIVQLASGAAHTGFAYLAISGDDPMVSLLDPEMSMRSGRYYRTSPDDFFYLVLRDPTPRVQGFTWKPDGGAQPPPSWLPAVHRANATRLGADVTVYAFAPGRFTWKILPGRKEKTGRTAEGLLHAADLARASVAISLGIGARKRNRRGLVLDDVLKLPIRPELGVIHSDGDALHIARAGEDMVPLGYASELVLLVESGELRSEARKLSALRTRSTACTLPDGMLLIAVAKSDSLEPMAVLLRDAGCKRVVELNRGKQVQAFVHRAGKEDAPRDHYDDTSLYGMARYAGGGVTPFGSE